MEGFKKKKFQAKVLERCSRKVFGPVYNNRKSTVSIVTKEFN